MPKRLNSLKHIVVLMMENPSFDHMRGDLKKQNPAIDGLDGTETNPDTTALKFRSSRWPMLRHRGVCCSL
jgi:phospholipase C